MAKRYIGRYQWRKDMVWGWAIFNTQWDDFGLKIGWVVHEPWIAHNADTKAHHRFNTHEAATNFVRSEIDSLRTSD